jgi:hypothetical protein
MKGLLFKSVACTIMDGTDNKNYVPSLCIYSTILFIVILEYTPNFKKTVYCKTVCFVILSAGHTSAYPVFLIVARGQVQARSRD